jgi:flagellar motor protein MotB
MRFIVLLLALITSEGFAQTNATVRKKVESVYNEAKSCAQNGESDKAIKLLHQVLDIDPNYYMAYFGLADIYHEKRDFQREKESLMMGLNRGKDHYPNGYKFLAALNYKEADYTEGLQNMEQFKSLKGTLAVQELRLLESCRFAKEAMKSPLPFHPVNAGPSINSTSDEYWPSLNGEANKLVFTRLLSVDDEGKKLTFPQEDFFVSQADSSGWSRAIPLGKPINTSDNEGAQCISADGRLLFFTGCGRSDGIGSCDIYMSVQKSGLWSDPVNLGPPINSKSWESQPSVSADGKWLYFTSNRAGGKGGMDIWRSEKLGVSPEGLPVYGKVVNMESINTSGNENSPFIHPDGKSLYFASDFWPGMGGKDLFYFNLDSSQTAAPRNLGYPLNSEGDEEGLIVDVSGNKSWYTVDKKDSCGRDIYWFLTPESFKPKPVSWVKGRITSHKTGKLLSADLILNDLVDNRLVEHLYPFENEGAFLFCLPAGHNYGIMISKPGYLFHSENFNLLEGAAHHNPKFLDIMLDPIERGKTTILKNIFFDTDSFNLKAESKGELEDLVQFMKDNSTIVIEIGGHTDNQGSKIYNETLSSKRAQAVVDYLISKGIAAIRLQSKGYGFSVPLGNNATEEGRKENRRTEFKVR